MAQFRKKPVVIEALQFSTESMYAVKEWMGGAGKVVESGHDAPIHEARYVEISTLEGTMRADPGDWIIRGVAGEFYPCKPDIFAATYEPAEPLPAPEGPTGTHDVAAFIEKWGLGREWEEDFSRAQDAVRWQERSKGARTEEQAVVETARLLEKWQWGSGPVNRCPECGGTPTWGHHEGCAMSAALARSTPALPASTDGPTTGGRRERSDCDS